MTLAGKECTIAQGVRGNREPRVAVLNVKEHHGRPCLSGVGHGHD